MFKERGVNFRAGRITELREMDPDADGSGDRIHGDMLPILHHSAVLLG